MWPAATICLLLQASAPAGADAALRRELVLELLAKVRYPFRLRENSVLSAHPGSVRATPPRLVLGPTAYHLGVDVEFPLRPSDRIALPFFGLERDPDDADLYRLRLRARDRQVVLRIRCAHRGVAAPPPVDDHAPRWHRAMPASAIRGHSVQITFDNLGDLLGKESGPAARYAFLAEVLLPAFRRASAARTRDPGPGLRGRENLLRRLELKRREGLPRPPATFHSDQLTGMPALGFLVRRDSELVPADLQEKGFRGSGDEQRRHDRLLARFLDGIVHPLPQLPNGATAVMRPDDTWNRHGLGNHRAIDLGSSVLAGDGTWLEWPAGTPIAAPHTLARAAAPPRRDGRAWTVELHEGDYCLRIVMLAYHVESDAAPRLAGFRGSGTWRSSDPVFRRRGLPKGNHVHLEILGLFPTAPKLRALFARWRLQPALRRARRVLPAASLVRARPDHEFEAFSRHLANLASAVPEIPGLREHDGGLVLERRWPAPAGWSEASRGARRLLTGRYAIEITGRPVEGLLGLEAGPVQIRIVRLGPSASIAPRDRQFEAIAASFLTRIATSPSRH